MGLTGETTGQILLQYVISQVGTTTLASKVATKFEAKSILNDVMVQSFSGVETVSNTRLLGLCNENFSAN